ncbi:uncharacterized protein LOC131681054 [Topomyia yanbarensis]|uniref:uncharacterized protein LOC131681054 n=1 Tax=Topomyia yanbarensis TaxID=2498891 RepID=UPI00273B699D|nr:uncharacterized protein LOC131681054 [Topomyia yanbarensis]
MDNRKGTHHHREREVEEGFDDMQMFVELDNYDFMRLKLRTKVIKLIQRMQKEILDDTVIEETLENESDEPNNNGEDDILNVDGEVVHEEALENNDRNNVYHGVVLETVININVIFQRTPNGKAVMEILKEGQNPNDICLTAIKRILCEYLKSMYGLRPSAFHKNLLAQSLVNTYPQLASSTPDVPQALWFHPNGRSIITQGKVISSEGSSTENTDAAQPVDMNAVIKELKFLCPGPNMKLQAEELWSITIDERNELRRKGSFDCYLLDYPVSTAFNGSMVTKSTGWTTPCDGGVDNQKEANTDTIDAIIGANEPPGTIVLESSEVLQPNPHQESVILDTKTSASQALLYLPTSCLI